jgi:hypothetical protein
MINVLKILILNDLLEFFVFWYVLFPKIVLRHFFDQVYILDHNLKFKANLRNITKPLYGDYSFIGYLIAFPYRIFRILFALFVYFILFLFYLIFIIIWLLLPLFLLINGFLFSK